MTPKKQMEQKAKSQKDSYSYIAKNTARIEAIKVAADLAYIDSNDNHKPMTDGRIISVAKNIYDFLIQDL